MKLYRVLLRGMDQATSTRYGCPYVVAESADAAVEQVQAYLAARKLGVPEDRELDRVELLAEEGDYPACRVQLFLAPVATVDARVLVEDRP
jgi:hypothetical protein